MGRARELFTRIQADGLAAISQLIDDRVAEHLFLDFKRSGDDGAGARLNDHDAANLAKAISGFGNSDGGILIWGVDRRRDANGQDTTQRFPLVEAARFRTLLETAVTRTSTPPHPGVQNHTILDGAGPNGYVVTLIPKAEFGPIRARVGREDYYLRAGDSFYPVPHDALAGLFGRRPSAVIWPQFVGRPTRRQTPPAPEYIVSLGIMLYSPGPVLVERAYLSVHALDEPHANVQLIVQPVSNARVDSHQSAIRNFQVVAKEGLVIAPGGIEDFCNIALVVRPPIAGEVRLQVTLGAHNAAPARFELHCSAEQLQNACDQGTRSDLLLHTSDAITAMER